MIELRVACVCRSRVEAELMAGLFLRGFYLHVVTLIKRAIATRHQGRGRMLLTRSNSSLRPQKCIKLMPTWW